MESIWKGVMPAVTTKFKADDSLDLDLFNKNLDAQIRAGVHGLILGGSLGEASTLRAEEKIELLRAAVTTASGRVHVISTLAEQATREAVAGARQAERYGANGIMLLPPLRYRATPEETLAYLREVAGATSLPLMIYNNPVDYGIAVSAEQFERLLELPNIQAVKESTRDVSNITLLKNRFGDRLKILCGVDTLALESLLMGAEGWVAGLCCAFPEETVALYELAMEGRREEALDLHRWFFPLLELDVSPQLVQNIKLAEVATGLGSENVRPPRQPLKGAERERVLKILEEGIKSRPDLSVLKQSVSK